MEEALINFPTVKVKLSKMALEKNEKLAAQRLIAMKKQPVYQR